MNTNVKYRLLSILLIVAMLISPFGNLVPGDGSLLISRAFAAGGSLDGTVAAPDEETVEGESASADEVLSSDSPETTVKTDSSGAAASFSGSKVTADSGETDSSTSENGSEDSLTGDSDNEGSGSEGSDNEGSGSESSDNEGSDSEDSENVASGSEDSENEGSDSADSGDENSGNEGSGTSDGSQDSADSDQAADSSGDSSESDTDSSDQESSGQSSGGQSEETSSDESDGQNSDSADEVQEDDEAFSDGSGSSLDTDSTSSSSSDSSDSSSAKSASENSSSTTSDSTGSSSDSASKDSTSADAASADSDLKNSASGQTGAAAIEVKEQTLSAAIEEISPHDKKGKVHESAVRVNSIWNSLFKRDPLAARDRDSDHGLSKGDLTVSITGSFPKGATAKVSCILYDEEDIYSETALAALDLAIYDAEGLLYEPSGEVTIKVGGSLVKNAVKEDMSLLVYSCEDNAARQKKLKEYAADVLVYRDSSTADERIRYTINRKKDSIIFQEDADGLLIGKDKTAQFTSVSLPSHLILSTQVTERTLRADTGKNGTEVKIDGAIAESASATVKQADAADYRKETGADGSTQINLYYDRNIYTLWFYLGAFTGNGSYSTTTTYSEVAQEDLTEDTVYYKSGSSYYELTAYTDEDGNTFYGYIDSTEGTAYGLVDGKYVPLTISGTEETQLYTPEYTYTVATDDSTSTTYYGIDSNGDYVELTQNASSTTEYYLSRI